MTLPEMKEVAEKYKDRLTIISLSSDTKKGWKDAFLILLRFYGFISIMSRNTGYG